MAGSELSARRGRTGAAIVGASTRFEGVSVAVVTARDAQGTFLIRELQRLRLQVRHVWPSADNLPSDTDVVYCDYAVDLAHRLPWPTGEATSALVVVLPQNESFAFEALEAATPDAVLARPFTTNAVQASLLMGRSQFRYEQRMRAKIARLEDNLRSMRVIERAKRFLIASRGLDDDEAYSYIRKEAMTRRMPVSGVAEAIVASFEFFSGKPMA